VIALCFGVLLLSQAGMPFTTGFVAKFNVISAAVAQGHAPDYVLGVIAMLAAAIGVAFYLRVVVAMYQPPSSSAEGQPDEQVAGNGGGVAVLAPAKLAIPVSMATVIGVSVVFTVAFGIYPSPIVHFAERATLLF
jgi:NADH-quinone oxidoreductase subunit N